MALDWASVGDSSFRFGGMGASSRHQRTGNPTSLLLARRRAWFFGEPLVLVGTDDQPSPRVCWRAAPGASFQREARPERGWDACCGENRAYTTILWGTARLQPGRRDRGGTLTDPRGTCRRVSERPGHPPVVPKASVTGRDPSGRDAEQAGGRGWLPVKQRMLSLPAVLTSVKKGRFGWRGPLRASSLGFLTLRPLGSGTAKRLCRNSLLWPDPCDEV